MFGEVLYVDIERGDDIRSVDRFLYGDVEVSVQHFAAVYEALLSSQHRVIVELEAAACRVYSAVHLAYSTRGEGSVGPCAGIELLDMESAIVLRQAQDGQLLDF